MKLVIARYLLGAPVDTGRDGGGPGGQLRQRHGRPPSLGPNKLGLGQNRLRISGGGEVPNGRQTDHGSGKAVDQNVKGVGVGVGHSILHQHEENVVTLSDSLCGISHVTNSAMRW